jgi:hypothetical protein
VKKALFILVALVLAVSVGLIGCAGGGPSGPTPSSTIVLAASVSKTGPLKDIHDSAKGPVTAAYVAQNPTIKVGDTTFDVELDFRDDGSVLAQMLDNTDDIIDDIHNGKAHFLLGPTCTAFLEAQAPKATTGKVVQMTFEGGATKLIGELGDYEYSFINLSFSDWFQIPVLAKMLKEKMADGDSAYIGYQNDDHGLEYKAVAEKYFAKEGIPIDGSRAMTPGEGSAGTDDLVAKAKAAGSEILCLFGYPEFVFIVHQSAISAGYDPKAVILGPGACFGVYHDVICGGNTTLSNGVMTFAVANNKTSPAMADLFNNKLACPQPGPGPIYCQDFWGHPFYWTAMDFIYAGAKAVGSDNGGRGFTIDQDAFRTYLASTKINGLFGQTWYVTPKYALNATQYQWPAGDLQWPVPDGYGALLNYKCHTGEIGQWQNGYLEIVGYTGIGTGGDEYGLTNYVVTAPFQYPKPSWLPPGP